MNLNYRITEQDTTQSSGSVSLIQKGRGLLFYSDDKVLQFKVTDGVTARARPIKDKVSEIAFGKYTVKFEIIGITPKGLYEYNVSLSEKIELTNDIKSDSIESDHSDPVAQEPTPGRTSSTRRANLQK